MIRERSPVETGGLSAKDSKQGFRLIQLKRNFSQNAFPCLQIVSQTEYFNKLSESPVKKKTLQNFNFFSDL